MSSDDDENDEELFAAASLETRPRNRGTNSTKTDKAAPKVPKRKIIVDEEAVPESLTVGSSWTTENGSAFEDVKSAFIVETEKLYAAQLGSTYKIAVSGGKNGLKINCITDNKKEKREDCECRFGLTATWVRSEKFYVFSKPVEHVCLLK